MANEPQIHSMVVPWQQEFEQIEQAWLDWFNESGAQYERIEAAWDAFKAQLSGNSSFPQVGTWFVDQD